MGRSITVYMKDGTKKEFFHEARIGGSYTNKIRYEGGFAIITNVWETEIAVPSVDIKEIQIINHR